MGFKVVKPTEDLMFRKLFSSPENREVIAGFLNEVLRLKVEPEKIDIKNPYSIKSYIAEQKKQEQAVAAAEAAGDISKVMELRETIRDVTLSVINVGDVTIEMQLAKVEPLLKRLHYYIDDVYVSNYNQHLNKGETAYDSLKPVFSLNVLGFDLFKDDRALRSFSYRDDETLVQLAPVLKRIGFFELTKTQFPNAAVANWQQFLVTGLEPPQASKAIKEAAKIIQYQNRHQRSER